MKYKNWLKNRNLSKNTIDVYLKNYDLWKIYLHDRNPNKTLFTKYIKDYSKTHKPRSTRLLYSSVLSIFRFEKKWKLLNECKDIRLPRTDFNIRNTINMEEYNAVNECIILKTWYEKRNWLIFSFLLLTGLRVSELLYFNKNQIYDKNKILIKGKGDKRRVIFLNDVLLNLLKNWKANRIAISTKNKLLTTKQINLIIQEVSKEYFDKYITPHGLRRSYATNLLKSNVNLEIVRKILGHSNINTTSRYIHYTDDEIISEISKITQC